MSDERPSPPPMRPLGFERLPEDAMRERATHFLETMRTRRSVRQFSDAPIPLGVVERCIEAAAQAPSGAHKQPWTFVLVSDPATKRAIREAAEEEERTFYGGRAPDRWLSDLEPFGTDWEKPYLEHAPALIAVFAQRHGATKEERHYYVNESVGIATGFLIAGLHHAGLATLTHTPSPMGFLAEVLERPANERPYLLLPVGYPAEGCEVPDIERKPLDEVLVRR
ncbi:MAG TPA: nitroreductase family protein [Polyangiaceae bacterium LLY-WYZ-15_(1-7)]|nr:nitroreductase family protein [Polyangiaceae bacterium LLY-WYZ-15_(1-7)]HJL06820.1 nitroreductase family protein [Polyangiaceae bacterium LLY-WYZ-15_(1-7)]HJL12628.1 nitroreductase family protein [Polyangiaceae bacterium LLY-WYZ-15_(1-7)]HJL21355.1 nitroreductase family protein [Polyangiaceae bacterium LLY-WYZ-15_(1-7)]HJL28098.1 nitroreductase family protein [Polyangiaceae bacterium LLY-WYZ-15_(1-7)]